MGQGRADYRQVDEGQHGWKRETAGRCAQLPDGGRDIETEGNGHAHKGDLDGIVFARHLAHHH